MGTDPTTNFLYIAFYIEITLALLLVFPFLNNVKTALVKWAAAPGSLIEKSYPFLYLGLGLLLLLLADSHRTMSNQLRQYYGHADRNVATYHLQRAVESEVSRNLAASCLMLTLFINRYFILLKNCNSLLHSKDAMESQAKGASQLASKLLDENAALEKQLKMLQSLSGPASSEEGKKVLAHEEELNKKIEKLQADLKDAKENHLQIAKEKEEAVSKANLAETQIEAIKKQSANTQDEYMRVLKENQSLKTKNEDLTLLLAGGKDKRE